MPYISATTSRTKRAGAVPPVVLLCVLEPVTTRILVLQVSLSFFFFNDTATTEIYTLSLHDALPISSSLLRIGVALAFAGLIAFAWKAGRKPGAPNTTGARRDFGFQLRECAKSRGFVLTHPAPVPGAQPANSMPHVAGMGAAVAVCDANGDGWPDLYATNSEFGFANALYLNQKDGTFRDVARAAGLADVNVEGQGVSMGSIWADYDGDGRQDCFLYKWGFPQLFRNNGDGTFADVTEAAGLKHWMNANSACWIDYDRDGRLDLYVAGYFREDIDLWHLTTTKIMQASFEFAKNGGRKHLY